jgi:hypothetical protein
MADLKQIPDDVKWQLAAACAAELPALYDAAFRNVVGECYDQIEQEIWMELSRTALEIARNLALPVRDAHEIGETLRTILIIWFGPGFNSETLDVSKDRSVIVIKRCPLLDTSSRIGVGGDRTFHKCMAFTLTAILSINKEFSGRFVRTMCSGDRQCEFKIERMPDMQKTGKK